MLYSKPSIHEALKHHGVKGMKWGVRKTKAEKEQALVRSFRGQEAIRNAEASKQRADAYSKAATGPVNFSKKDIEASRQYWKEQTGKNESSAQTQRRLNEQAKRIMQANSDAAKRWNAITTVLVNDGNRLLKDLTPRELEKGRKFLESKAGSARNTKLRRLLNKHAAYEDSLYDDPAKKK